MKNPLYEYGLFGYSYRYLLTHPWKLIERSYYHSKWFAQRGWRGYADCDVWSLDSYLAGWLPSALGRLLTNKLGHPATITRKEWDSRLKRMEAGFREARKLMDMDYKTPREYQAAHARMKRDLRVFTDNFLSLWD